MGSDLAVGRFVTHTTIRSQPAYTKIPYLMMRRFITHPALALGSTLLWGAIELLALLRSRWSNPRRPQRN